MMTGDMGGKTYKEGTEEAYRAQHGVALIAIHPVEGIFLGVNEKKKPVFQKINNIADDQAIPTRKNPHELRDASNYASKMLECNFLQVKETNPSEQITRFGDISFDLEGFNTKDIVCVQLEGLSSCVLTGSKKRQNVLKAFNLLDQFTSATLGHIIPVLRAEPVAFIAPQNNRSLV